MDQTTFDISRLIQLCIAQGREGPWRDLITALKPMITAIFRKTSGANAGDLDEFLLWFPGWLFEKEKLQRLRSKLDGATTGDCWNEKQVEGYLGKIVLSARGAFYRGRQKPHFPPIDHPPPAPPDPSTEGGSPDRSKDLESAIKLLPVENRVPFRLRFYKDCRPLPPEDVEWIAQKTGKPAGEIEQAIDAEFEKNGDAKYPLSAKFIGDLLGIPPDGRGRYSAVHQRVCRSRDKVKTHFLKGGE